jgi:hypothetical protein
MTREAIGTSSMNRFGGTGVCASLSYGWGAFSSRPDGSVLLRGAGPVPIAIGRREEVRDVRFTGRPGGGRAADFEEEAAAAGARQRRPERGSTLARSPDRTPSIRLRG